MANNLLKKNKTDKLSKKRQNFLEKILADLISSEIDKLQQANDPNGSIPNTTRSLTHEQEIYFMEVLQRGDINEICSAAATLFPNNNCFWSVASSEDGIPLKHSGLPDTIVKTLSSIIAELWTEIKFKKGFEEEAECWKAFEKDQNFEQLIFDLIADIQYLGDGALCSEYDTETGKMLFNYKTGRNVDFIYDDKKRLIEIVFLQQYETEDGTYLLRQSMGADSLYVHYKLYNDSGEEVKLSTVEELKELIDVDIQNKDNSYIDSSFATQLYFFKSNKYEGRGASIFTNKIDAIDTLDEVISQRQSTLRSSSPKEFLSEDCISKSASGSVNINQTAMHKFFMKASSSIASNGNNDIEVIQAALRSEEYRIQEEDAKRRIYEGILSEQTLSNNSTINNSVINTQREKLTMYTVNKIKKALQQAIPKFVYNTLKIYYSFNNKQTEITPNDIFLEFAEYNNPSWETQVAIAATVKQNKILPNYYMLKELYGETKGEDELREMAATLDFMDGYTNVEENQSSETLISNETNDTFNNKDLENESTKGQNVKDEPIERTKREINREQFPEQKINKEANGLR